MVGLIESPDPVSLGPELPVTAGPNPKLPGTSFLLPCCSGSAVCIEVLIYPFMKLVLDLSLGLGEVQRTQNMPVLC